MPNRPLFGGKSYFSQQHILTILTSCASNKKSATKKLFYYVRSGFGSKAKSIILSSANGNRHVVYKVKIYTYNILHSLGLKSFDMFFNADLLQFDRSIRWIVRSLDFISYTHIYWEWSKKNLEFQAGLLVNAFGKTVYTTTNYLAFQVFFQTLYWSNSFSCTFSDLNIHGIWHSYN